MALPVTYTVDMTTQVSLVRSQSPFYGAGANDDYHWGEVGAYQHVYHETTLFMGEDAAAGDWNVGFLFRSVDIKRVSTINEAHLTLTSEGIYSAPLNVRIYGVAPPSVIVTPATYAQTLALVRTLKYVDWAIPLAQPWVQYQKVSSPDISSILQELINRKDWRRKDNLQLLMQDIDTAAGSVRKVYSIRASSGDYKPELHIGFTEPE